MNRLAKFAVAALVAGVPVSASAQVEYTLEKDPAFPSVVYVEFDPSTMPQVYTAPSSGSGLPVIRGGEVDGNVSTPSGTSSSDTGAETSSTNSDDTTQSIDERAQSRVKELLDSGPQEIEDMIIDRKIEDQAIKDLGIDLDS